MSSVLEDTIPPEELTQCQLEYERAVASGGGPGGHAATQAAQFSYAWALTRTRHRPSLRLACQLLESLYKSSDDETAMRDYLYYIAIAKVKLGEYEDAFKYLDGILKVQPNNHQVRQLRQEAESQRRHDGALGLAMFGGAAVVVGIGAAVGAAIGLAKLAKR